MYQNKDIQRKKENIVNLIDYPWENWIKDIISIKGDQKHDNEPPIFNELFMPAMRGWLTYIISNNKLKNFNIKINGLKTFP